MARSSVAVFSGNFRSIEGLAQVQAKIAAIDPAVIAAVKPAVEKVADIFMDKLRPIIPVDDLEANPGNLQRSLRREQGPTELSVRIIEDGEDDKGRPIAKHVEHGHKTPLGGHVAAKPHFWVAYNVVKKSIKSRVGRAMTKAAKDAFAK